MSKPYSTLRERLARTERSLLPVKGLICDSVKYVPGEDGGIEYDMGRLELILRRLRVRPMTFMEAKRMGRAIDAELKARRS